MPENATVQRVRNIVVAKVCANASHGICRPRIGDAPGTDWPGVAGPGMTPEVAPNYAATHNQTEPLRVGGNVAYYTETLQPN